MKAPTYTKKDAVLLLALAILYFASAKLGLRLAIVNPSATAVWPPTGIALATLFLLGRRFWPAIFLGAFVANLSTAGTPLTSLGIAIGNTLESFIGVSLIWRFAGGRDVFYRFRNVCKYVLFVAVVSTAVSATIGVSSLAYAGFVDWSRYGSVWFTWWLGDSVSAMVAAPVLILWGISPRPKWTPGQWIEVTVLLLFLFLVSKDLFNGLLPVKLREYLLSYLCVPLFLWAAYRLGQREAASSILILSTAAIWGVWHGVGPLVRSDPEESLLLLQSFMGTSSLISMVVGAVAMESKITQARDIEAIKRLSLIKDEFVTIVTHELRTPLAAIKEGLNLVLEGVDGPITSGQADTLGIVKRNVDRLARMVSNVLDFQKLGSGVGWINFGSWNAKALVEEVCQTMQLEVEKKQAELRISVPPQPVVTTCDGDRIRQVLVNLIDNAMKFIDIGGRITVSLQEPQGPDGDVRFVVEDTGIGIKQEDQDRIFDMFSQSTQPEQMKTSGFGVGLTVCKRIVDLHRGKIWIESKEGEGSRFIFTIPRRPSPAPPSPSTPSDHTASG